MGAVQPYPHIEMHVRDESIATILEMEVMPLDKPLYFMRTQKGPVGKPMWCPTYTYARLIFGADTFNKFSKYWSENSYFLLKTLTKNGAFIMRCCEETAVNARAYVEVGYKETDVPQWQRNSITGLFNLNEFGAKIPINAKGEECKILDHDIVLTYNESADTSIVVGKQYYYRKYGKYTYTAFKDAKATKNLILWKGLGDPTFPVKLRSDEVTASDRAKGHLHVEVSENVWEPVENDSTALDTSKYYAFPVYTGYEAVVVNKDDDINEIGVYYTRTPDLTSEYEYPQLDVAQAGDAVATNGDITRTTTIESFVKETESAPVGGREYFTAPVEIGGAYTSVGELEEFVEGTTYFYKVTTTKTSFIGNYGKLYVAGDKLLKDVDMEPQATIPGLELVWRVTLRNAADERGDADPTEDNGYMWYPALTIMSTSPGEWGSTYGFKLYYDKTQNTIAGVESNGAVTYSFAPVELLENDTVPTAIVDAYGEQVVNGTVRADVIDKTTELPLNIANLIPAHYSGSRELPVNISWFPKNFDTVGKLVIKKELEAKDAAAALFPDLFKETVDGNTVITPKAFIEDLLTGVEKIDADVIDATENCGHMANIVSCRAPDNIPYFASYVLGTYDEAKEAANATPDVVDMNSDSAFFLKGGADGPIDDADIERYTRRYIDAAIAGTHDYLIDYLRCPYNNIIDTGVSLPTKRKFLDFMGVRDNLTVFLTPQQIWKNADGTRPKQLSRFEDESIGAALRSYGLLMREDIENSTEANRAVIFLAQGLCSDHDWNNGLVASTLWIALKNAQYLSGTYIKEEPVERPNSEIDCYDKGLTWTAASEETRSRCWNAGLNYAQYFDMNGIHYASVRSIYKYDTSVLCDLGTVRAVTFCKDIIRSEWTVWAGSKRKADDLNARIQKKLNDRLAAMLNGKYTATVSVYQTDMDKKYGYVRHVELELESPAQNRVWLATIICKREGFDPNAED